MVQTKSQKAEISNTSDAPVLSGHTPTPWRVETGTTLIWGDCTICDDGTTPDRLGVPVADAQLARPWSDGRPSYNEADANAAFIVRAVNSHDALVKALENIAGNDEEPRVMLSGTTAEGLRNIARAALEAARSS